MSIEVTKDDEKRYNKAIDENTHALDNILCGILLSVFFLSAFMLLYYNVSNKVASLHSNQLLHSSTSLHCQSQHHLDHYNIYFDEEFIESPVLPVHVVPARIGRVDLGENPVFGRPPTPVASGERFLHPHVTPVPIIRFAHHLDINTCSRC